MTVSLPPEMHQHVCQFLDVSSFVALSSTCRALAAKKVDVLVQVPRLLNEALSKIWNQSETNLDQLQTFLKQFQGMFPTAVTITVLVNHRQQDRALFERVLTVFPDTRVVLSYVREVKKILLGKDGPDVEFSFKEYLEFWRGMEEVNREAEKIIPRGYRPILAPPILDPQLDALIKSLQPDTT